VVQVVIVVVLVEVVVAVAVVVVVVAVQVLVVGRAVPVVVVLVVVVVVLVVTVPDHHARMTKRERKLDWAPEDLHLVPLIYNHHQPLYHLFPIPCLRVVSAVLIKMTNPM